MGKTSQAKFSNIRNNRDKEMASMLKKMGVKRTHGRCPICNNMVSLNTMYRHIVLHR